jgi:hypothetical protein
MAMRAEFALSLSLAGTNAAIRVMSALGDPLAGAASRTRSRDPYPFYARIRRRGTLVRSRLGPWVTASHAVASQVLRSPDFCVEGPQPRPQEAYGIFNWPERPPGVLPPLAASFLAMDPPAHTRLRRLVSPSFTPGALRAHQGRIEEIAHRLIDGLAGDEPFDLMERFAAPFPILVICELLGIPHERHRQFATWGTVLGNALGGTYARREVARARQALLEVNAFFDDLIAARRRVPGDDVISRLISAVDKSSPSGDQTRLTDRDVKATCLLLFLAGFETMVNLIGNGVRALLTQPGQWAALRAEPSLAPAAVEEALRFDSPVQLTSRVARRDTEVDGRVVRAGAQICLILGGANRDPEVFPRPDTFTLSRPNAREHLALSSGVHYCLGAPLGRLEGEIAFQALVKRLPHLRLCGPVPQAPARSMRGVTRLPLCTDAPSSCR